jgi:hypothetical protein
MKTLLAIVLMTVSATAVAGALVREEIRGDKKICYYTDGFYIVVSAYSSCPFKD